MTVIRRFVRYFVLFPTVFRRCFYVIVHIFICERGIEFKVCLFVMMRSFGGYVWCRRSNQLFLMFILFYFPRCFSLSWRRSRWLCEGLLPWGDFYRNPGYSSVTAFLVRAIFSVHSQYMERLCEMCLDVILLIWLISPFDYCLQCLIWFIFRCRFWWLWF